MNINLNNKFKNTRASQLFIHLGLKMVVNEFKFHSFIN